MSASPEDFNAQVIREFRANDGRVGGDRLYATMAQYSPQFAEYEKQTDRVIPALVLTPAGGD